MFVNVYCVDWVYVMNGVCVVLHMLFFLHTPFLPVTHTHSLSHPHPHTFSPPYTQQRLYASLVQQQRPGVRIQHLTQTTLLRTTPWVLLTQRLLHHLQEHQVLDLCTAVGRDAGMMWVGWG